MIPVLVEVNPYEFVFVSSQYYQDYKRVHKQVDGTKLIYNKFKHVCLK
jgi:hypothetical protein